MDLALKNREWRTFKLHTIFEIENCKCSKASSLKKGIYPYVGATNRNNGVLKFAEPTTEKMITKGNCVAFICDGEGSVGYSIYKYENFIGSTTVKVGRNKNLNRYIGTFITTIADTARSKYNFGFKRNEKHLKNEVLILPANTKGEPDYEFMEAYMRDQEKQKAKTYKTYIDKRLKELKNTQAVESLTEKKWEEFLFPDIFEIKKGFYNKKPASSNKGKIPFLGATQNNNGITEYYTKEKIKNTSKTGRGKNEDFSRKLFKGNCIAVTNNGSVGHAYYQANQFTCSHDINPLYLKNQILNKHIAMFLITTIEKQKDCFEYARKWRPMRMVKSKILLPVTQEGNPDYAYMENYMKQLELKKINSYLNILKPKKK